MDSRRQVFRYLIKSSLRGFAVAAALMLLVVVVRPAVVTFLVAAAVALAAAIVAAFRAAAHLDNDLSHLSESVRRASAGQMDARVPLEARVRLGPLAAAIAEMNEQVASRFTTMRTGRDRLRAVLDTMIEAVVAVDPEQRVTLVNAAACKMFHLEENTAIGRPFWELVRNTRLQQWLARSLEQAEPVRGELELLAPEERTLLVHVARLPGHASGGPGGAMVVMDDVTELRRLERVRTEFVANASHELKTPLASIKACVETLREGAINEPEHAAAFLGTVAEQTDRLDALVQDLLALARIESGGAVRERHPLGLTAVVSTCVQRYAQGAARRQQTLSLMAPDDDVFVLADEEAVERILENLLDNAIKYTPQGGTVTVRWSAEDSDGLLEVEDTGIGIPRKHLPRIFERFYRVDRARARELGGTGLGLSIVKNLVHVLGGTIAVTSSVGQGSIFTVRLPLAKRAQSS